MWAIILTIAVLLVAIAALSVLRMRLRPAGPRPSELSREDQSALLDNARGTNAGPREVVKFGPLRIRGPGRPF